MPDYGTMRDEARSHPAQAGYVEATCRRRSGSRSASSHPAYAGYVEAAASGSRVATTAFSHPAHAGYVEASRFGRAPSAGGARILRKRATLKQRHRTLELHRGALASRAGGPR